ncbi:TniQ family protein [Nitrospira sp. Nam74]
MDTFPQPNHLYDDYPVWDVEPFAMPPRSRLYGFAPLGVGTPEVESLASYVTRLADAHALSVRRLVMRQIVPGFPTDSQLMQPLARRIGARINGFSPEAERWCRALEQLTGRTDLRFCTLLPWQDLFDSRHLMRDDRAWCPACLEQWNQSKQTFYEPLLWSCEAVTVCMVHRIPLQSQCPSCNKKLPIISSNAQIGFCNSCGAWLGQDIEQNEEKVLERDVLFARAMGNFLQAAPSIMQPLTTKCLKSAIDKCQDHSDIPNFQHFSSELGMTLNELRSWMLGCKKPRCASLLRLSVNLQTSPLTLLQDPAAVGAALRSRILTGGPPIVEPSPFRRLMINKDKLTAQLDTILKEWDLCPLSLSQVAGRLRKSTTTLRANCPVHCAEIVKRYDDWKRRQGANRRALQRQEIERAIPRLLSEGLSPTWNRIRQCAPSISHPRNGGAIEIYKDVIRKHMFELRNSPQSSHPGRPSSQIASAIKTYMRRASMENLRKRLNDGKP